MQKKNKKTDVTKEMEKTKEDVQKLFELRQKRIPLAMAIRDTMLPIKLQWKRNYRVYIDGLVSREASNEPPK